MMDIGDNILDIVDGLLDKASLNADQVMQGLQSIAISAGASSVLNLVDPGIINSYMKPSSYENADITQKRTVYIASAVSPLFTDTLASIMPLYDANHWSLLIYLRSVRRFYYFDSMGGLEPSPGYHNDYVFRLMGKLVKDNLISETVESIARIECNEQESSYECGQYVVMFLDYFIRVFLMGPNRPRVLTRENVEPSELALIKTVKTECCETNRVVFVKKFIRTIELQRRGSY